MGLLNINYIKILEANSIKYLGIVFRPSPSVEFLYKPQIHGLLSRFKYLKEILDI